MKKVLILFLTLSIFSCKSDDDNNTQEISILGEWTQYSSTNSSGETTVVTENCPNILSIFTDEIVILDYIDIEEPCVDFDSTTVNYTISNEFITTTNSNGGNAETSEILTLNSTTLRLKFTNGSITEYRRTI